MLISVSLWRASTSNQAPQKLTLGLLPNICLGMVTNYLFLSESSTCSYPLGTFHCWTNQPTSNIPLQTKAEIIDQRIEISLPLDKLTHMSSSQNLVPLRTFECWATPPTSNIPPQTQAEIDDHRIKITLPYDKLTFIFYILYFILYSPQNFMLYLT